MGHGASDDDYKVTVVRYETLMDELSNVYSKPLVTSGDIKYTNGH